MSQSKIPVVVLISGRGSNLQALIDNSQNLQLDIDIKAVISNRPDVAGLQRAEAAGIPAITIDHTQFADRSAFEQALQLAIDQHQPALVILAGFMRILGNDFVLHYQGRMLNIHPSLLPKYPGLNTHQRAIDNHDSQHGASIHFVTTELDGGPAVVQVSVDVLPEDTADTLATRVLEQEHNLYCTAIQWFAEKRLLMQDNKVIFDNQELQQPLQLNSQ